MNSHTERALLRAVLRRHLLSFVIKSFHWLNPGEEFVLDWCLQAIAYHLEQVRLGKIQRLIVNMPPRSLKSLMASVAFPAYLLGHDPTLRIICASYAGELSRKFSNDFRSLITAPWYREIFPQTRIGRKDTEFEIELTMRGCRLATSVGGPLTGRGGRIIIIDDPLRAQDALSDQKRTAVNDWFGGTLSSRLDDKRAGAIIVVMQRLHSDDLTGHLCEGSDDWTVLSLPAIAEHDEHIQIGDDDFYFRRRGELLSPTREPLAVIEKLKRDLGSDHFFAQYQQSPVPPGGAMVKRDWVQRYDDLPPKTPQDRIVQSWDTATNGGPDNDWSVCTTWRMCGEQAFLLDVWRARVDYPHLKAQVQRLAELWKADEVLVEEAGTAVALLSELKFEVSGMIGVKPDRDKETRMSIASARFEAGQVFFPRTASWLAEVERELFSFPGGKNDDQVDSISQALNRRPKLSMLDCL